MEKSLFAGLTILPPDESILTDDGAFIGRDRRTIDRLLEIGAKTHRHTGLPGLPNPQLPLQEVQAIPSGGAIAGDQTFVLGYTLVDSEGGETMLSPTSVVTTAPAMSPPLSAPTTQINYASGGLSVDTYYYVLTLVDQNGGQTPPGAWATVEREPGFPNARVLISGMTSICGSASAVGWRLFRAIGGGTFDFLASGASAANAFTDDGGITADCDIHPPADERNTTNNINELRIVLPGSGAVGSGSGIRLYGTDTGQFLGDVLLDAYPASSAGQTVFFTSYRPESGSPPDRNQSIGGASKIDPDTEILDWHWKRPVQALGDLPAGEDGDVRLVKAAGAAYYYLSGSWHQLTGAGGGGSSSGLIREVDGPNPFEVPGTGFILTDYFVTDTVADGTWADAGLPTATMPVVLAGHMTHDDIGSFNFVYDTDNTAIGDNIYTRRWFTGDVPGYQYVMSKLTPGDDTLALFVKDGLPLQIVSLDFPTSSLNSFASGPTVSVNPDDDYWLQLSVIGNAVVGNVYDQDPDTNPAPLYTVSYTLVGAEATAWGAGTTGAVGIGMFSIASNQAEAQTEYVDDVEVSGPGGTTPATQNDIARYKEELVFHSSGGAHVGVRASGTSAVVTIHTDPGAAISEAIRQVRASGDGSVMHPSALVFIPSGGTQVAVSDLGSGSAGITVFASGGGVGPQGPPGASGAPGAPGASGAPGAQGAAGVDAPQIRTTGQPNITIQPTRELDFSGAGVTVTDRGGGSASAYIPGDAMAIRQVAASGNGSMLNPSAIVLSASGAAQVAVEDLGGGSAHVTIFASAIPGPQGPAGASGAPGAPGTPGASGANGLNAGFNYLWLNSNAATDPGTGHIKQFTGNGAIFISETDNDGNNISAFLATVDDSTSTVRGQIRLRRVANPAEYILYQIAGALTDNGTWDSIVTTLVSANTGSGWPDGTPVIVEFSRTGDKGDTGPQGPAGTGGGGGGASYARASAAGTLVDDSAFTEYRASGALNLGVASAGMGSAIVTIAPPGQLWASGALSLASGASGFLDFAGSAAGIRLLKISTSKRARVRMYGQSAKRLADINRQIGSDPTGDHGVLLDYAATVFPSGMIGTISPAVDAHNLDEPPLDLHYLTVHNYDATGTVTVAFLILPTEVV